MRTFAAVTFAGVSGIVLFKLFVTILFPLLGMFIGLLAMTVKLALIAAVACFVWSLVKKRNCDEIVVE